MPLVLFSTVTFSGFGLVDSMILLIVWLSEIVD